MDEQRFLPDEEQKQEPFTDEVIPFPEEEPTVPGNLIYEILRPMVMGFTIVALILSLFTPMIMVSGESMRETLQDGDRILAVRPWLCGEIKRGDIVIVREESFDSNSIIKRVIAVGGDTVDIDFTLGTVTLNGEVLEESYIRELTFLDEGVNFPLTVEEGSLFLLGDNRNNSTDSRYPDIGTVKLENVVGKAAVLLFPGETAEVGGRDLSRIGLMN